MLQITLANFSIKLKGIFILDFKDKQSHLGNTCRCQSNQFHNFVRVTFIDIKQRGHPAFSMSSRISSFKLKLTFI